MAVNTSKMWSKGIEIAFFSESLQISPSGWGICPQTPIATGDWRLRPQTPVCDTFGYTSLLNTSPKVDILHFLIISFRPFPLPKSWLRANRLRLQIFHSTISLPSQKVPFFENFWWRHCMWFVVWGPPNQKFWLRLWLSYTLLNLATKLHIDAVQQIQNGSDWQVVADVHFKISAITEKTFGKSKQPIWRPC